MKFLLQKIDWWLWIPVLLLCAAGTSVLTSFDPSDTFAELQWLRIALGIFLALVVQFIDPGILKTSRAVTFLYIGIIAVLALTLLVATPVNGARSWIDLGFFSFQPADIAKVVVIIVLAKYFARRHVEISRFRHVIISAIYAGIPAALIIIQPDFGSAMVFGAIWFGVLFISEIPKRYIFGLIALAAITFTLSWIFVFANFQKERILVFLNPGRDIHGSGYNTRQAIVAVGSGQILGTGVGLGSQSRLQYLPEYRTDFIFAAFAEEWGFVGGVLVLILFAVLCLRLLYIAYHMQDNFDVLFVGGLVALLLAHIIVNIGMNIGLLPVTGIPLPFMSYGGTHVLMEMVGLGIVNALWWRNRSHFKSRLNTEIPGL